VSEITAALERIRARIATPEKWTKGWHARDRLHCAVLYESPNAVSFCLDGALRLETPKEIQPEVRVLLESCVPYRMNDFISWQDKPERTHADILRLIDHAIAKAEAAG
jgi:hypothetical protein